MSPAPHHGVERSSLQPHRAQQPSRLTRAALLVVGAAALTLLVVQVVAGGSHGVVSGQNAAFEQQATAGPQSP